jgi:hypothetical protein
MVHIEPLTPTLSRRERGAEKRRMAEKWDGAGEKKNERNLELGKNYE